MTRVGFIEDLKLMFWLGIPLRIVRINTMSGGADHMQTLNGYPNAGIYRAEDTAGYQAGCWRVL